MVDYEAKYEIDYPDREAGWCAVLFPQHVQQFVVVSDEKTLFGVLSVHQLHRSSELTAYRSTHGKIVSLNRLPDCL